MDLSLWDNSADYDFDIDLDAFSEAGTMQSFIDNKTGDALHRAAAEVCMAQIPECGSSLSMLQLAYGQRIKSDCSAYENSLKQRKNESQNKLSAAQRALREAALEQLQAANKYDLGQCTLQFKKCMQTTAECGEDFSGCASVSAMDNTNVNKSTSRGVKKYAIKGKATTIEIFASTYDTLLAKKPLCDGVTKECTLVANKVWDTFLKEVAPAVKSAELIAEDNMRQDCIGNISSCFQKACKDNMDPNDPDGSYDMCLTRPETMLNLCKIPLNACGIDASSAKQAENSQIWGFVLARLASMRVDSCTKAVKDCLQSEDRCGTDYTQCVGLDTDTIMRMCPYDKLVGCQKKYGEKTETLGDAVYDEVYRLVQGVMLNIDNNMLTACQNAANDAMIQVCGDTENCNGLSMDDGVGTRSLEYSVCDYTGIDGNNITWGSTCYKSLESIPDVSLDRPDGQGWAGKLSGVIYWGGINYSCQESAAKVLDENGETVTNNTSGYACTFTSADEYISKLKSSGNSIDESATRDIVDRVYGMEINVLQDIVNNAINQIESDPTVQFCMTGRTVQGVNDEIARKVTGRNRTNVARFPDLTYQMRRVIAASVLKKARENYDKKYDSETKRMMQDQVAAAERIDEKINTETKLIIAQNVCDAWAESSALPVSKAPEASSLGKWIVTGLIAAATITAVILSQGALAGPIAAGLSTLLPELGISATTAIAGTAIGVAGAGAAAAVATSGTTGKAGVEQWNYKETITTMFNQTTGVCTKVRVSQNCEKTKKNYCDKWAEPVETREEVTLL